MRYSAALVLGTVAVSQAANLRHASFHARRQAEASKRGAADVDWSKVTYDLSGVDWSKVDYSSSTEAPASTPTPTPAATSAAAEYSAPVEEASSVKAPATSATPTPTPVASAKATTTSVAAPAETSSTSDTIGGAISDLLHGVESLITSLGIKGTGVNSVTANGGIWIGDDSAWKTEFTNDGAGDMVVFCWQSNGFSGMSLNVNLPAVSVGLKKGEKVTVSFAEGVPAACAPAFSDTKLALFGGIDNTWYEATFGKDGAFDVSKNVNMNGNSITAKGSKCVSDMTTCVFECQDSSAASCETGYQLSGMSAAGCGGGYDTVMAGVGGGCSIGADAEHVKVTFS